MDRTFAAYTRAGILAVPAVARSSGSCWTMSIAVADPSAYRCMAGNDLLDPCFTAPHEAHPSTVACVPDPWSRARVIALTQPLPAQPRRAPAPHRYWALELANGAHCVAVTGTVPTVGGVPLDYLCGSGTGAGAVHRAGGLMLAGYGSLAGSSVADVVVTTAWNG